ncbi:MAG: hypothetical protein ABIJ27_07755, partial [Candidatus Omnitrophota bacterium]
MSEYEDKMMLLSEEKTPSRQRPDLSEVDWLLEKRGVEDFVKRWVRTTAEVLAREIVLKAQEIGDNMSIAPESLQERLLMEVRAWAIQHNIPSYRRKVLTQSIRDEFQRIFPDPDDDAAAASNNRIDPPDEPLGGSAMEEKVSLAGALDAFDVSVDHTSARGLFSLRRKSEMRDIESADLMTGSLRASPTADVPSSRIIRSEDQFEPIRRRIEQAESYEELLMISQEYEELTFLKCKRAVENELAVYAEDGGFTGFYNACIPDTAHFIDKFHGADLRRERRMDHLKNVDSDNFARFDNLLNYLLSWSRDDMVNTWHYYLDWKMQGTPRGESGEIPPSLWRCLSTYAALIDFYSSEEQMEKIDEARRRYFETGVRQGWDDNTVCIDPRFNPITKEEIPGDRGVALQMDVLGQLIFMVSAIIEDGGMGLSEGNKEFLRKLVGKGGYLDSMNWEDFGIWEEGNNSLDELGNDRKHIAEMHTSSVALLLIGLKKAKNVLEREGVEVYQGNIDRAQRIVDERLRNAERGNFESDTRPICFGILFSVALNRFARPEERIFTEAQEDTLIQRVLTLDDREHRKGLYRYRGDTYNAWGAQGEKEVAWPFGYGLLSLIYALRALEASPAGGQREVYIDESEHYLKRLADTLTNRGIPESFQGDDPIVLNPLGYPMAAYMAAKTVLDRARGLNNAAERTDTINRLVGAMNDRYEAIAQQTIREVLFLRLGEDRLNTNAEFQGRMHPEAIEVLSEFLDSDIPQERSLSRAIIRRYIGGLNWEGVIDFCREVEAAGEAFAHHGQRFNMITEVVSERIARLFLSFDAERKHAVEQELTRIADDDRTGPFACTMILDGLQRAAKAEPPVSTTDFPKSVIYDVNLRHFVESGRLQEAIGKLRELRDLGVTDIVLAPPIFEKGVVGKLRPVFTHAYDHVTPDTPEGGLPPTELVKSDDADRRYGSQHCERNKRRIDREFGSEEDFRTFVDVAHAYGIRVHMDWVSVITAKDSVDYPRRVRTDQKSWAMYADVDQLDFGGEHFDEIMTINARLFVHAQLQFSVDGFRMDAVGDVELDRLAGENRRKVERDGGYYTPVDWFFNEEVLVRADEEGHAATQTWNDFKRAVQRELALELESRRGHATNQRVSECFRLQTAVLIAKFTGRTVADALEEKVDYEDIRFPSTFFESQWHHRSPRSIKSGVFDAVIGWPLYFEGVGGAPYEGRVGLRHGFEEGKSQVNALFAYLRWQVETFGMPDETLGTVLPVVVITETHDTQLAADYPDNHVPQRDRSYCARFPNLVGEGRAAAFYGFLWSLGGTPMINTQQEFGSTRLLEQFGYHPHREKPDERAETTRAYFRRMNRLKQVSPALQTAEFERKPINEQEERKDLPDKIAVMRKRDMMVVANLSLHDFSNEKAPPHVDLSCLVTDGFDPTKEYRVVDLLWEREETVSGEALKNYPIALAVGEARYLKVCEAGQKTTEESELETLDMNEKIRAYMIAHSFANRLFERRSWSDAASVFCHIDDVAYATELFTAAYRQTPESQRALFAKDAGVFLRRVFFHQDYAHMREKAASFFNALAQMDPELGRRLLEVITRDPPACAYLLPRLDRETHLALFVVEDLLLLAGDDNRNEDLQKLDSALSAFFDDWRSTDAAIKVASGKDVPFEQWMLAIPNALRSLTLSVGLAEERAKAAMADVSRGGTSSDYTRATAVKREVRFARTARGNLALFYRKLQDNRDAGPFRSKFAELCEDAIQKITEATEKEFPDERHHFCIAMRLLGDHVGEHLEFLVTRYAGYRRLDLLCLTLKTLNPADREAIMDNARTPPEVRERTADPIVFLLQRERGKGEFVFTRMLIADPFIPLDVLAVLSPKRVMRELSKNIQAISTVVDEDPGTGPTMPPLFSYKEQFEVSTDFPDNAKCKHNVGNPSEDKRTDRGIHVAVHPSEVTEHGIKFRVYAPGAKRVSIVSQDFFKGNKVLASRPEYCAWAQDPEQFVMERQSDGTWEITIPLSPWEHPYGYHFAVEDDQHQDWDCMSVRPVEGDQQKQYKFYHLKVSGHYTPEPAAPPEWHKPGMRIYELFPRCFGNFGSKEEMRANIDRIADWIKEHGYDIVWLMPSHPVGIAERKADPGSPYAIRNPFQFVSTETNPYGYFGTEGVVYLQRALEERGIKLMFDTVLNHSARDHILAPHLPSMWTRMPSGWLAYPNPAFTDVMLFNHYQMSTRDLQLITMARYVALGARGFRCDLTEFVPIEMWHWLFTHLERFERWSFPDRKDGHGLLRLMEGGCWDLGTEFDDENYYGPGRFNAGYGMKLSNVLGSGVVFSENPEEMTVLRAMEEMEQAGVLHLATDNNHDIDWLYGPPVARYHGALPSATFLLYDLNPGVFIPMEFNGDEIACQERQEHHGITTLDLGRTDDIDYADENYRQWRKKLVAYEDS